MKRKQCLFLCWAQLLLCLLLIGPAAALAAEPIDIRDAAPGVPVPEALLGIEKHILDKNRSPCWWALSIPKR